MYKGKRLCVLVPACNESGKIGQVAARAQLDFVDQLVIIDDGSDDDTAQVARDRGAHVISTGKTTGVGAALRVGITHALRENFDLIVIMAGNNKDNPEEIPRLLDPLCNDEADFVMGSRYLGEGRTGGDMPLYRRFATRLHPLLLSAFTGKRLTESTNGFRGIRASILRDPRINLHQRWLDGYGLEVYLLWKVITLGYRHTEAPCTKIYPPKKLGYTKMKPITGWWNILRPIFLLGLGIRR